MPDNVRMHGPALMSSVIATKYTVPAGQTATLQHIHIYNPSSSGVTFAMSIGTDVGTNRIYDGYTVGANQVLDVFCMYVLNAGEVIQAFAGANNILMLTLDGKVHAASTLGSGKGWGSLYDVDFTAQPSQTMTAAGSYTIDGKTWWAKATMGAGSLNSLIAGVGLRLTAPASVVSPIANWRGMPSGFGYDARANCFALSQIPKFNPLAPYAVQWRFTSNRPLPQSDTFTGVGGILDVAGNAAAITAAELSTAKSLTVFSTTAGWWIKHPYPNGINFAPSNFGVTVGSAVYGIVKLSTNRYYPLHGAWSGNMQTPDDYTAFSELTQALLTSGLSNSPNFVFALEKASNDASTLEVNLTHLRVLQPCA
jgi:hypothetical protein